jgi:hypothetical protein
MGNDLADEGLGFQFVRAILGWEPGQVNEGGIDRDSQLWKAKNETGRLIWSLLI